MGAWQQIFSKRPRSAGVALSIRLRYDTYVEVNERSFGILIAYIIPGWIVLLGMSYRVDSVAGWVSGSVSASPTIGGFLYSTLASIGLGVATSTIRWLTVDSAMKHLGVRPKKVKFNELRDRYQAMTMLIDGHYRYYQFHGNLMVALPISMSFRWASSRFSITEAMLITLIWIVLFLGAKDSLAKYYQRSTELLRQS